MSGVGRTPPFGVGRTPPFGVDRAPPFRELGVTAS
jgi:hypothetical protein